MKAMTKVLVVILAASLILTIMPVVTDDAAWAQSRSRISRGALYGAGAGLLFGNGLDSALGGAAIGAGVGAVTTPGYQGEQARRSATRGALYGAGAGLIFGGGLDDALVGGLIGGAAGGIYGGLRR